MLQAALCHVHGSPEPANHVPLVCGSPMGTGVQARGPWCALAPRAAGRRAVGWLPWDGTGLAWLSFHLATHRWEIGWPEGPY